MNAATDRLAALAISPTGFVFDPRSGATFTVNDPGRAIIEALREGHGLEATVQALADGFEVGKADLRRDVLEYARVLRDQGLLPADYELV